MYLLNMLHIFSLVCFLIYGVKSRFGHDRSKIVPLSAYLFKGKCGLNNRIIRIGSYGATWARARPQSTRNHLEITSKVSFGPEA